MNKKMQNLKEIEYYENFNIVGQILIRLKKKYPENIDVKNAIEAMTHIGFYVNEMQMNTRLVDEIISEHRSDKLRAVERARRVEKEIEDLKKKYGIKLIQK